MTNAIERVSAACLHSKYKDDRHEWILLMGEDNFMGLRPRLARYALRQCVQCKLTVLLVETGAGAYGDPPRKEDTVVYAFFSNEAPV